MNEQEQDLYTRIKQERYTEEQFQKFWEDMKRFTERYIDAFVQEQKSIKERGEINGDVAISLIPRSKVRIPLEATNIAMLWQVVDRILSSGAFSLSNDDYELVEALSKSPQEAQNWLQKARNLKAEEVRLNISNAVGFAAKEGKNPRRKEATKIRDLVAYKVLKNLESSDEDAAKKYQTLIGFKDYPIGNRENALTIVAAFFGKDGADLSKQIRRGFNEFFHIFSTHLTRARKRRIKSRDEAVIDALAARQRGDKVADARLSKKALLIDAEIRAIEIEQKDQEALEKAREEHSPPKKGRPTKK